MQRISASVVHGQAHKKWIHYTDRCFIGFVICTLHSVLVSLLAMGSASRPLSPYFVHCRPLVVHRRRGSSPGVLNAAMIQELHSKCTGELKLLLSRSQVFMFPVAVLTVGSFVLWSHSLSNCGCSVRSYQIWRWCSSCSRILKCLLEGHVVWYCSLCTFLPTKGSITWLGVYRKQRCFPNTCFQEFFNGVRVTTSNSRLSCIIVVGSPRVAIIARLTQATENFGVGFRLG